MATVEVPETVRSMARSVGADAWLAGLPALVDQLERDWDITLGPAYEDATEACVAAATLADGSPAVLKLLVQRQHGRHAAEEMTVLRLANGEGCVRLLRHDEESGEMAARAGGDACRGIATARRGSGSAARTPESRGQGRR